MRVELRLRSVIFSRTRTEQAVSNFLTRSAKRLKEKQRQKQIYSPKTGRDYLLGRVPRRLHRASARGEYPAPDTMKLVNSLEDQKQSSTKHTVYQDDAQAEYGKYLVRPRLERKIIPSEDVAEFNNNEGREELRRLSENLK